MISEDFSIVIRSDPWVQIRALIAAPLLLPADVGVSAVAIGEGLRDAEDYTPILLEGLLALA